MASTAACAAQTLALQSCFVGQKGALNRRSEVRGVRVVALATRNASYKQAEEKGGFFDWLTNTALTKGNALNEKDPLLNKVNDDAAKAPASRGRTPAKKAESAGFNFGGFGKK